MVKKLRDICSITEHTISKILPYYERITLVEITEADIILAATIIAEFLASWTFNDSFRIDRHLAKRHKTTVRRLVKIMPCEMTDYSESIAVLRIPEGFRKSATPALTPISRHAGS